MALLFSSIPKFAGTIRVSIFFPSIHDCFAELTEHFLPTNKASKQSPNTPPVRSEIKSRITKIYDSVSSSGSQNCDGSVNKADIAGFLKSNGNSNRKHVSES